MSVQEQSTLPPSFRNRWYYLLLFPLCSAFIFWVCVYPDKPNIWYSIPSWSGLLLSAFCGSLPIFCLVAQQQKQNQHLSDIVAQQQQQSYILRDSAPICILQVDLEGICTHVSGPLREDLHLHILPSSKSLFDLPLLTDALQRGFRQALQGRKNKSPLEFQGENYSVYCAPLYFGKELQGVQLVFHRKNEHAETLRQLAFKEEHYRRLIENIQESILTVDAKGHIQMVNSFAEQCFGYPKALLHNESIELLCPGLLVQGRGAPSNTIQLNNRCGQSFQWNAQTKAGKQLDLELQITKITLSCGTCYMLHLRDISKYQKLQKLQDEFVSMVSHELRTPMTSIQGSMRLLQSGAVGALTEKQQELVLMALRNAQRLTRLLNDLLDVQKLKTNHFTMQLKPIEVGRLLTQSRNACLGYSTTYKVDIEISSKGKAIFVMGDQDRLLQVMNNLISNAIKHTPELGTVRIGLNQEDYNVRIFVEDQGMGVPQDAGDRIFEKFQQADSSSTRQIAGTGLGLTIAKAIIEKHGGSIGFENKENNAGSIFWFELPTIEMIHNLPRKALHTLEVPSFSG